METTGSVADPTTFISFETMAREAQTRSLWGQGVGAYIEFSSTSYLSMSGSRGIRDGLEQIRLQLSKEAVLKVYFKRTNIGFKEAVFQTTTLVFVVAIKFELIINIK